MDDRDLEEIAEVLGDVSQWEADGKRPFLSKANREVLFSDLGLLAFFQWIWFALEVQFSDFSAALKAPHGSGLEGGTRPGSTESPKA